MASTYLTPGYTRTLGKYHVCLFAQSQGFYLYSWKVKWSSGERLSILNILIKWFLHSDQIWVMGILSTEGEHGLFKCSTRPKLYQHSINVLFHPCGWSSARLFENILSIGLENVGLENKVLVTVLLKILVLSEPSKKWITFETFC